MTLKVFVPRSREQINKVERMRVWLPPDPVGFVDTAATWTRKPSPTTEDRPPDPRARRKNCLWENAVIPRDTFQM